MICIRETQRREEFVRDVLYSNFAKDIDNYTCVLLKPNIVSHEPYPTTTHPGVVRTCVEFFLEHKKQVIVADGPAPDAGDTDIIISNHPIKTVCDELEVPLLNLLSYDSVKTLVYGVEVETVAVPFEYDLLISLPVLKSHFVCKFTGALKNQLGFIAARDRMPMHFEKDIHRVIAATNMIIRPDFYVMDAIDTLILSNEVRHGGKPGSLGFMLAGSDPVALDMAGFELLKKIDPKLKGQNYESIRYLKHAIDLGIGKPIENS